MFDDLIPENKNTPTSTPTKGGGSLMFDDLVPKAKVKGASNSPALVKAIAPENVNDPTFSYDKNDSTLTKVATAVGNVPKSIFNIGKGLFNVVRHPVDTVKNVANLVAGTAGVGAEKLMENTDLGQKFLQKANESRIARGLAPLKADADGKLQAEDTDQTLMAKNVGGYFKDRYGGLENIKKTAVEDPAGIALDVSALFTGGSTLAPKVAKVAEVADLARTANVIRKAGTVAGKIGEFTDPIRQTSKIVAPVITKKLNGINEVLSKSGKQLQSDALKEGLYGMNETVGTLKKKFENTSYTYTKPDGVKVEINPIDTLSEYNLIPQPARGGSIDVSGIKSKIPSLKKEIGDKIDTILKTDGKTISIDDYAKQLDASIDSLDKSKLFKQELAGKIETELKNLEQAYPDGEIPLDEINKIRKEANGEYRDDKIDLARIKGNATREIVYGATDDMAVKDLLNEQRKLINAEDYADKLAIHKVKGGRLGNYVYTTLGAIMGGATKLPFGIGETVGAVGGRALSELLQRRQLRSIPADLKAGIEKVIGGGPMTVDVKAGIEKLLGGQKSPKSTPQSNTAKTTATIEDIIPETKVKVNGIPERVTLDDIRNSKIKMEDFNEDGDLISYREELEYLSKKGYGNRPINDIINDPKVPNADKGTLNYIKKNFIDELGTLSTEHQTDKLIPSLRNTGMYEQKAPTNFTGSAEKLGLNKLGITDDTVSWVEDWINRYDKTKTITLPKEVQTQLSKYKPTQPVTLYRGATKGSKGGEYTSWTYDKKVAERFAGRVKDGEVVTKVFQPNDIVIDFTKLPEKLLDNKTRLQESEVVIRNY